MLEIGSLTAGGYGLVKGGIKLAKVLRTPTQGANLAGQLLELKTIAKGETC